MHYFVIQHVMLYELHSALKYTGQRGTQSQQQLNRDCFRSFFCA